MGLALLLQQTAAQKNGAELRNEIQQTIREATAAARQAAADAKAQSGGGNNIVIPIPPTPPTLPNAGTSVQWDSPTIPPQVESISLAFFAMIAFIIVGLSLARAFGRRMDRSAPAAPVIPREVRDQLQQISQSVDAIAIEVERISEGQRFTTKLLADKRQEVTMMTPGSTGQ